MSTESRRKSVFVWSSQKPVLKAIAKVLDVFDISAVCFTQREALLDKLIGLKPEQTATLPLLTICGDDLIEAVPDVCSKVSYPLKILISCNESTKESWKQSIQACKHIHYEWAPIYNLVQHILHSNQLIQTLRDYQRNVTLNNVREVDMSYLRAREIASEILVLRRIANSSSDWPPSRKKIEEEAKSSRPFLSPNVNKLQSQLWHEYKNFLNKFRNDDNLMKDIGELLQEWEKIERGKSHDELQSIIDCLKDRKRKEAAKLSLSVYSQQVNPFFKVEEYSAMHEDQSIESSTEPISKSELIKIRKFDILIVDDDAHYLSKIRQTFERLARNCDEFTIDVISVNPKDAYEDALCKLRNYGTIQAVVVDWDLSSGQEKENKKGKTGARLIQEIRRDMPWLYVCLLTGVGVMSVLDTEPDLDVRPFDKHDIMALEEIFADIVEHIRRREKMPFFDSLKEYSQRPITVFHALAISRGKALRKSVWLRDFYDFYGERVFMAETSTTQPPLDSLLAPKGSIKEAHEKAAQVFGADKTFFITNGTSAANKIVHQGLLKPGDKVLIDRNCHKSHHYGLVLVGAKPIYLQADPIFFEDEFTGICKGVTLNEILEQLDSHPDSKMLCITNCTFDGYVHDVEKIIKAVFEKLEELEKQSTTKGTSVTRPEDFVFLIDEAWFGFARFLPELRRFTGMYACKAIPQARVYSTQSTHKTLMAFRQGSMLHVRDPHFHEVEQAFDEAFFTHTTTSPNYNIIASLDAGRMQADLEGPQLAHETWYLAKGLRDFLTKELNHNSKVSRYFHLLTPEEMGVWEDESGARSARDKSEFAFDNTKLTIFLKKDSGLTGEMMRCRLLEEFDIQLNKITNNTLLFMVNIGSTESSTGHLVTTLRKIAAELDRNRPEPRKIVLPASLFQRRVTFYDGNLALREYFFKQLPLSGELSSLDLDKASEYLENKRTTLVSANFVIPYPPGFPVLVPGEVIDQKVIDYLRCLKNSEIHGMSKPGILEAWIIS